MPRSKQTTTVAFGSNSHPSGGLRFGSATLDEGEQRYEHGVSDLAESPPVAKHGNEAEQDKA